MRLLIHAFCILGAVAVSGCGQTSTLHVASPFPTRDALDRIATAPVQALKPRTVAVADTWTVDQDSIDGVPSGPEAKLAVVTANQHGLTLAPALRCAAREHGRFFLSHRAQPTERLRRFIGGACGAATAVDIAFFTAQVPEGMSDEQVAEQARAHIELPAETRGRAGGVWLGRKGDRMIVTVASASREVTMTVGAPDASGRVDVKGSLAGAAPRPTAIVALMTWGPFAVVHCERDPQVMLPEFAFACPMSPGDGAAWLEVATRAPARLLAQSAGVALVRRDPKAPLTYTASGRKARPVSAARELQSALHEGVNEARRAAGLAPLALAPKQTPVNERLAPHFFAADLGGDQSTEDTIALGLMAGWEVEGGMIRHGDFYAALSSGTSDAAAFLDYALEMPMGRATLLDADVRQIAIGAAAPSQIGGVGAVVTTYAFFSSQEHRADADRITERLAWLRASRGHPRPQRIPSLPELNAQARLAAAGKRDPMDALQQGAVLEGQKMGRALSAWAVVTHDIDTMSFPEPLLAAPGALAVGVEVTHFRPENAAWGAYLVYLVTPAFANVAGEGRARTRNAL